VPAATSARTRSKQARAAARVQFDLTDIQSCADRLKMAYLHVYDAAYSPRIGESAHVRAGKADPTGSIGVALTDATGHAQSAEACRQAKRKIANALDRLLEAEDWLRKGIPGWKATPRIGYAEEFPQSVKKSELAEFRERQAKRRANGEF
jgi:hypothetical protein